MRLASAWHPPFWATLLSVERAAQYSKVRRQQAAFHAQNKHTQTGRGRFTFRSELRQHPQTATLTKHTQTVNSDIHGHPQHQDSRAKDEFPHRTLTKALKKFNNEPDIWPRRRRPCVVLHVVSRRCAIGHGGRGGLTAIGLQGVDREIFLKLCSNDSKGGVWSADP